jgi:large subunit ribosomal protein L18
MTTKATLEKKSKWRARRMRINKGLQTSDRPMLTVYRSAKHIYAQIVNPGNGETLGSVSTRSAGLLAGASSGGVDGAKKVGAAVAALAKEKNIETVVFNRNGFLYHGRVKALAEAAREAGLQF